MSEFKIGDSVRVIDKWAIDHDAVCTIVEAENPEWHEQPYKLSNGYWRREKQLELVTAQPVASAPGEPEAGVIKVATENGVDYFMSSLGEIASMMFELDGEISMNGTIVEVVRRLVDQHKAQRQQLAAAVEALTVISRGANMPYYCEAHGFEATDHPISTMQLIASEALRAASADGE